ncbi:MAG: carbohydrate kinase [Planctomycetaceae bacterium]|nr:carbohydrate kinase [Planctomycetales bacterium]MCB9926434.1 carbohydrate kinase [Planctomycetaceae bacterium]
MSTKGVAIVGLGEVLWDVFPDGPRFGGAPANYACHAASLGADAYMASAVGRDELGDRAMHSLQGLNVDTSCVQRNEYSTGAVHVQLDQEGKASYEFLANTAWDHIEWTDELAELAARADAVCFGTLGQRSSKSAQTIRRFVESTPKSCMRIFDINLRPPFYADATILVSLAIANVLKLNDDELPVVAKLCGSSGNACDILQTLARRFDLGLVALTRGANGALLVRGDEVTDHPGVKTSVIDTVGAGDAFTATMTVGLLYGLDLAEITDYASQVAAYVCSKAGATPRLPANLLS